MKENELKKFIFEASRASYASGDDSIKHKEADGSTTITYSSGEYRMHDNYFGGEPYGGREVVFLNNKVKWMMVYYGLVYEGPNKEVYQFLTQALSSTAEEMLYRGPVFFEEDFWRYENDFEGDLPKFSGIERIFKNDLLVYEASYLGGFVDR